MKKSITIALLVMLALSSVAFIPNFASGDVQAQSLWVRMRGIITHWGETPVFGWVGAHAGLLNVNGTHHEWARVHAIWSEEQPRLNCTQPPTENFTFVFYTARLMNLTEVKLDYSGYNLYISGQWKVIKTTITVNVDENGDLISWTKECIPIIPEAYGELHVMDTWRSFELDIAGINKLSGIVVMGGFLYREVKICDTDGDGKVNLVDLVKIAKRYKTIPGMFSYDHEMDFNFDDTIDVGDLATIAANIELP